MIDHGDSSANATRARFFGGSETSLADRLGGAVTNEVGGVIDNIVIVGLSGETIFGILADRRGTGVIGEASGGVLEIGEVIEIGVSVSPVGIKRIANVLLPSLSG